MHVDITRILCRLRFFLSAINLYSTAAKNSATAMKHSGKRAAAIVCEFFHRFFTRILLPFDGASGDPWKTLPFYARHLWLSFLFHLLSLFGNRAVKRNFAILFKGFIFMCRLKKLEAEGAPTSLNGKQSMQGSI